MKPARKGMSPFFMTMREPNLQAIQTGISRNSNRQIPQKKWYGSVFIISVCYTMHQTRRERRHNFAPLTISLCSRRNHLEAFFEACDYPELGLDAHRDAGPAHWCALGPLLTNSSLYRAARRIDDAFLCDRRQQW